MKALLILAILLLPYFSDAQNKKPALWNYGAELYLSLNAAAGKGLSTSLNPGFQTGIFVSRKINPNWELQTGLNLNNFNTTKSASFNTYYVTAGRTNAANAIKNWYISAPLLGRYRFNKVFSAIAGPQFNYLFYSDENLLKSNKNAFRNFSTTAVAGVEASVSKVIFSARYQYGISNINNVDNRYKWHTNQVLLGMAIKFK